MRSSLVVRASDCQCTSCNGPGFDPSIRRHSGIWGAADEAVLNKVWKKNKKSPPKKKKKKKKKEGGAGRSNNHRVFTKCQAFCPVVLIGSPHSLIRKRMLLLPLWVRGGRQESISSGYIGWRNRFLKRFQIRTQLVGGWKGLRGLITMNSIMVSKKRRGWGFYKTEFGNFLDLHFVPEFGKRYDFLRCVYKKDFSRRSEPRASF